MTDERVATREDVLNAYSRLPAREQLELRRELGLPPPPARVLGTVWLIVIGTLAAVVIGGGLLIYSLIQDDKETEVLVGFVSAALGALIGLLAPSPTSSS